VGLRVNNNIAALNAYRNLSVTDGQMTKSLEKLSSGFRINRAADDAAGLAISEGLRSQIGGLKVAVRNTQDGISVVQTAEGALTETHSILQRMRDLSVQASNDGGINTEAKKNIQSEISQLKDELTRIADTTTFNGTKLLDGDFDKKFQVGANVGETISVAVNSDMSAGGLGLATVDVSKNAIVANGAQVTGLTLSLIGGTAPTGVEVNGKVLDLSKWSTSNNVEAAAKNRGLLEGEITKALQGTEWSFTSAWDATTNTTLDLTFNSTKTDYASGAAAVTALDVANIGTGTGATGVAVSVDGSSAAIKAIDAAIKTVSNTRADLGAIQNRFDHTINNLNVTVENLTASESRIRDADMAQEMVQFTRNQILSQAGTAMLAQANQASQGVLSLLR
jgi:flagellin